MVPEKANILCLLTILSKFSDSAHILSMSEILYKMKSQYDITADRRTVYRNIDVLIDFGYDISKYEENQAGYYLRERDFELSEIHMLCDAVLTAECIPENQGRNLIQKLQKLASVHQTKYLNRLSLIKTDKKSPNLAIFFNIEILDEAISLGKQVEFDYLAYSLDLIQRPRREEKYVINPYALYWSNCQYYLIANMEPHEGITHFRIDRIANISIKDTFMQSPPPNFNAYDYASKALFMFGGDTQTFTIKCDKSILNDVVDAFGNNIVITNSDENTFTTIVRATTGGMRLWAIHYIETCEVISPDWLINDVKSAIKKGMAKYKISN